MDRSATLAHPLELVFHHLASPACLGDWLPEVTIQASPRSAAGRTSASFAVGIRSDGTEHPGTGELIAYEPPWAVAYRLITGTHTHVVRLTCTASNAGTQVRIHQSGDTAPLAVDLARLRQALASSTEKAAIHDHRIARQARAGRKAHHG
jgi:uncharacterized protein YndB with AHSA1/START domain